MKENRRSLRVSESKNVKNQELSPTNVKPALNTPLSTSPSNSINTRLGNN